MKAARPLNPKAAERLRGDGEHPEGTKSLRRKKNIHVLVCLRVVCILQEGIAIEILLQSLYLHWFVIELNWKKRFLRRRETGKA